MDKQTYKQMEQDLITIANNHQAKYDNHLREYEEAPFFIIYKYNVPTLADMRMLAEKYGVTDVLVSEPSWGCISIDFLLREFQSEEEVNNFIEMTRC